MMRAHLWMSTYGGTYAEYLDTPEGAIELLLRMQQVRNEVHTQPLQQPDRVPLIG